MRGTFAAAALVVLTQAGAASAIVPALCKDDGVTEVPPFAKSRDADQCLVVDPGNGDPDIRFQYETFHKYGVGNHSGSCGSVDATFGRLMNASDFGKCSTRDQGADGMCTYIVYDVVMDNYLHPCTKAEDIHFGSWAGRTRTLWYQVQLMNGWKCKGGAWVGPNGLSCSAGEDTAMHTDGLQINGPTQLGGWWAMIDSKILNSGISLGRMGNHSEELSPKGNLLLQGFEAAMKQAAGEATTYIDDCIATGRGADTCTGNRFDMAYDWDEAWLIDVYGNVRMKFHGSVNKVVLVNTGCGESGCGGSIDYDNGWPYPLHGAVAGPGTCPNGLITQSAAASDGTVTATFCYTSIENALNDQATSSSNQGDCPAPHCPHKRPPFIHLSKAGWANPPSTGSGGSAGIGGGDASVGAGGATGGLAGTMSSAGSGGLGGGGGLGGVDAGETGGSGGSGSESGSGCSASGTPRVPTSWALLVFALLALKARRIRFEARDCKRRERVYRGQ